MSTNPKCEGDGTIQCPICSGMGRIYPEPLIFSKSPDCTTCEIFSGVDCPNCEGLGKIDN